MRAVFHRLRSWRPALLLLAGALLLACSATEAPRPAAVAPAAGAIVKGELDTREYRYLQLPNRMRVLLVSDPQTDKAAASLQVRAGSGDDPDGRDGLAHFLEHMLFLGTGKFPDPGEYMAFINAHGGSNNAYTAIDHTNYFFDIEPGSLEPTLDRFAQFFIAPLFNAEYVAREMNAVDSEFRMGIKDDARREYDVLRELVQPGHPLSGFSVGSLETLRDAPGDIRADLLHFYDTHYSANLMTLVVLGREPLDALQSMAEKYFAAVPDRDRVARSTAPAMFAPGTLPMQVSIRPEKDVRELTLLFPVPSARASYAAKPLEYIGNALGHEGSGGLLSVLKARGWVESLSAGSGFDLYDQDVMQISMQLTAAGLEHQSEIIALAFDAIALLRDKGIEKWRFGEQGRLADIAFRFREKGSATAAVIGIGNALRDYPVEDVLRAPYLYRDFDRALIQRYLSYMRPDNVLVTLSAKGVQTDRQSVWYKAPYAVRKLDPAALLADGSAPRPALRLPPANEFVPASLALKPLGADTAPALLAHDAGYRLWYAQERDFRVPRGSIYVQLLSSAANDSARGAALTELFANMVQDQLNEFAYPATLAGLQYDIVPGNRGLTVKVGGYDNRQAVLLDKILHALRGTSFDAARFATVKAELVREWSNSVRERPFLQLVDRLGVAMIDGRWTDADLARAAATIDLAALQDFAARIYGGHALEVLVHGNYTAAEAARIGERVHAALGTGADGSRAPALAVTQLPAGSQWAGEVAIDHADSAVAILLQGADASDGERARMALSAQILSMPFFDDLRTEKQLGYAVFAQTYPMNRVPGLLLAVQSPNTAAGGVVAAIDGFLRHFEGTVGAMKDAEFTGQRAALVKRLREQPKSLSERSERLWSDITLGVTGFDDRERVARAVEAITLSDWQAFYRERIAGASRRALLLYSTGAKGGVGAVALTAPPAKPLATLRGNAKYYRFGWGAPGQDPR